MANVTVTTTLADTERKLVIKHTQVFNDAASEENTILDISTKDYTAVAVERVWLNTAGGDASAFLAWEGTNDVMIAGVVVDTSGSYFDYTKGDWGGLTAEGAGATGDLIFTTANMSGSDQATVIVEMRKIF